MEVRNPARRDEESGPEARLEKPAYAVTIGAYDGVHLGHRRLLAHLVDGAAQRGLQSAVVTFDRHPAAVVRPESAPLLLTDLEQKLALLEDCDIDLVLVVPFDAERATEPAEEFVSEVLVDMCRTRYVVVGADFHFGHQRKGNVALLTHLGEEHGFEVEGVSLEGEEGSTVSSTRIRALLAEGDVAGAGRLLGRSHEVRGIVIHGDGRGGSLLGFPTANVDLPADIALPGVGIYAGRYRRPDGSSHLAAISVGRRPTFYEQGGGASGASSTNTVAPQVADRPLLEVFLLDFEGDLYGEPARVEFAGRIRDEQKFDGVEALVTQMHDDVARARALLASEANGPSG